LEFDIPYPSPISISHIDIGSYLVTLGNGSGSGSGAAGERAFRDSGAGERFFRGGTRFERGPDGKMRMVEGDPHPRARSSTAAPSMTEVLSDMNNNPVVGWCKVSATCVTALGFSQGLTLVPISAQLELFCPPYSPT
jgi:hypothetical protein